MASDISFFGPLWVPGSWFSMVFFSGVLDLPDFFSHRPSIESLNLCPVFCCGYPHLFLPVAGWSIREKNHAKHLSWTYFRTLVVWGVDSFSWHGYQAGPVSGWLSLPSMLHLYLHISCGQENPGFTLLRLGCVTSLHWNFFWPQEMAMSGFIALSVRSLSHCHPQRFLLASIVLGL